MDTEKQVWVVKGGYHARDPILRITAFGRTQEEAEAELERLRSLTHRLALVSVASPRIDEGTGDAHEA